MFRVWRIEFVRGQRTEDRIRQRTEDSTSESSSRALTIFFVLLGGERIEDRG